MYFFHLIYNDFEGVLYMHVTLNYFNLFFIYVSKVTVAEEKSEIWNQRQTIYNVYMYMDGSQNGKKEN